MAALPAPRYFLPPGQENASGGKKTDITSGHPVSRTRWEGPLFTFTPYVSPAEAAADWATAECRGLQLGDARLTARAVATLQTLAGQATASIPGAGRDPAEIKAIYRFLANPKVTPCALLAPHQRATRARIRAQATVLVLHDLTELNYTDKGVAAALGAIGDNKTRGLFFDPLLAVTPDRVPLGLVDPHTWLRATPDGPAQARKHWPIERKETYCWLRGYRQACALAAETPQTRLIYIADRGGDIYEVYQEAAQRADTPHADFVIRGCAYDRCLAPVNAIGTPQQAHLHAHLAAQPPRGTCTVDLPATAGRAARTVTQTLRTAAVQLRAPYRQGAPLADVTVHALLLTEEAPPPGQAAVTWLLYTSLPIATDADLQQIVAYYLARWEIECYFKVLKSGCTVERLYLQTAERLLNALACYELIAWRILYGTRLGQACPDLPCTVVFTPAEWEAVYLIYHDTLPAVPPTLQTLLHLVARGGGFVGRAGDGPPGIQTVWLGFQRAHDYALAYQRFGPGRQPRRARGA